MFLLAGFTILFIFIWILFEFYLFILFEFQIAICFFMLWAGQSQIISKLNTVQYIFLLIKEPPTVKGTSLLVYIIYAIIVGPVISQHCFLKTWVLKKGLFDMIILITDFLSDIAKTASSCSFSIASWGYEPFSNLWLDHLASLWHLTAWFLILCFLVLY